MRSLARNGGTYPPIGKDSKRALLSLFNETVNVEDRRLPFFLALHASATSLARALTGAAVTLALPAGLPVEPPGDEAATAEIEADGPA